MPDLAALARGLLPAGVAVAGGRIAAWQGVLYPQEEAALTRARAVRRAEFTAGRVAARGALAQLDVASGPLPRDPRGPVLWPDGVTGSLSHGAGLVLAAVARRAVVAALGIDIEAAGAAVPLDDIAGPAEIAALGGRDPVILFSAKEAAYKAQFALTGRMFGFRDLMLMLGDAHFTAQVPDGPAVAGRWLQSDGIVLTAATLPATVQPIA
ncbi:MAG: phosphopantetheinyl transferase [Rubellimicrobium sp.]|nr:phosphopantetheinyl transferase [Rubellimicrobium sp.]